MKIYIIFIGLILQFVISAILFNTTNSISCFIYSSLISFLICLYIVNANNLTLNFINPASIFLIGFLLFFLGRFISIIFDYSLLDEVFCLDFIFNYCLIDNQIFYIFFIINLILVSFTFPFLHINKRLSKNIVEVNISNHKIQLLFCLTSIFLCYLIYSSIGNISKAISNGYLALYASQAMDYQPPYILLLNSFVYAGLAVLFVVKDRYPIYFKIAFFLFLILLFSGILTGSRSSFITGFVALCWLYFEKKQIKIFNLIIIVSITGLIIYYINYLASISGAREISSGDNIVANIATVFFGQGVTLMVFNSSMYVQDYPILGAVKTIFPGSQVFFPLFGYDNRASFDWSAFMTYNENKLAYLDGYGLGWSVFSDFYVLSMGFVPLFCFFIIIFSKLLISVMYKDSSYKVGLFFIFMITFFTLSRESFSTLLFIIIIYTILCLMLGVLRIKRV